MPKAIFQLTFATVFVTVTGASAQVQSPKPPECATGGTAVIAGTVVDDSTGKPVAGSQVTLLMKNCSTKSDKDGRFRFEISPRSERVEAQYRGYRRFSPVIATVAAGDSLNVTLRLKPGGPIQDCLVNADCVQLLQDSPRTLNLEESFRLIAYGTTVALAWKDATRDQLWYACLTERSDAVFAELNRRYGRVVPEDKCELRRTERPSGRLHHIGTGTYAFRIIIDRMEDLDDNHRQAFLTYMAGGLWAQMWNCDFERTARGWKPVLCVMIGQA